MKATILDTVTGKTVVKDGIRSWEWADNNWSCDCNRELQFPDIECTGRGLCLGCKRFIVIAAEMNDPDDYEYTLHELNSEYPEELLKKHGVIK